MTTTTVRRPSLRRALLTAALMCGLFALLVGPVGCGSEPEKPSSEEAVGETAKNSDKQVLLNIGVNDRTETNPPSSNWALETPSGERWEPDLSHGGDGETFEEYPVGKKYELYLYPEGSEGPRLTVPFSMKPDMSSITASSKTYVNIYDDRIEVIGPAVPDEKLVLDRPSASASPAPSDSA